MILIIKDISCLYEDEENLNAYKQEKALFA